MTYALCASTAISTKSVCTTGILWKRQVKQLLNRNANTAIEEECNIKKPGSVAGIIKILNDDFVF